MRDQRIGGTDGAAFGARGDEVSFITVQTHGQFAKALGLPGPAKILVEQPGALRDELFVLGHGAFQVCLAFVPTTLKQQAAQMKIGGNMRGAQRQDLAQQGFNC